MKRILMNKGYIATLATTIIGSLYAFLGFIGTLVPLDEILPDTFPIWARFGISLGVLLGIWIFCFFAVGLI